MLQEFSNFIITHVKTLITVVAVTVMGLLPQTGTTTKPVDTYTASPSATISVSASAAATPTIKPVIKRVATPKPSPTPTPSPEPARVSVLLVHDGTTVSCLSEWADEVKRASQGVKDAEEAVKKISDCINSCSKIYEDGFNDCRKQYPHDVDPPPPGYTPCLDKFSKESRDCRNNCPHPSSGGDEIENLLGGSVKGKKFLQETKGEHCIDSK